MPESDDQAKMEGAKEFLRDQTDRTIALRTKDREFHGLEREFRYEYDELVAEFAKSADVRHPRDVGQIRENLLGEFLDRKGYLPDRYQVSHTSVRAVSSTGHTSKELDVLFTDALESVRLMNRQEAYGVYPLECTYGVIQVKSRLTKKVLANGLDNIASYKRLRASADAPKRAGRFGILFAYDSDLEWAKVVSEVEAFAKANPAHTWCNAIFILKQGMIMHGQGNKGLLRNEDLEGIKDLRMFGWPDHEKLCFFHFYQKLIMLLRETDIGPVPIEQYFRLPLTSGEWSYRFTAGAFAELGKCAEHGDYHRKLSAENLSKIHEWCRSSPPTDIGKAFEEMYGASELNKAAFSSQAGEVYIYNPDGLPLRELMVGPHGALAYDMIEIQDIPVWLPFRYAEEQQLVEECPGCKKPDPDS